MFKLKIGKELTANAARHDKAIFVIGFDSEKKVWEANGMLDHDVACSLFAFAVALDFGKTPAEAFADAKFPEGRRNLFDGKTVTELVQESK